MFDAAFHYFLLIASTVLSSSSPVSRHGPSLQAGEKKMQHIIHSLLDSAMGVYNISDDLSKYSAANYLEVEEEKTMESVVGHGMQALSRSTSEPPSSDSVSWTSIIDNEDQIYAIFRTQADALQLAQTFPKLHVFADEVSSTGCRNYIVATCEGFWSVYDRIEGSARCMYEVIREGRECKLYLDVEFRIQQDEDFSEALQRGNFGIDILITAIRNRAEPFLGLISVVELDCTTPTKFSRHLIVPQIILLDTADAGRWVASLEDALPAWVWAMVDPSVYSRNRYKRLEPCIKAPPSLHVSACRTHAPTLPCLLPPIATTSNCLADYIVLTGGARFLLHQHSFAAPALRVSGRAKSLYACATAAFLGPRPGASTRRGG